MKHFNLGLKRHSTKGVEGVVDLVESSANLAQIGLCCVRAHVGVPRCACAWVCVQVHVCVL